MVDAAANVAREVCDEVVKPGRFAAGYAARGRLKELGSRQQIVGEFERVFLNALRKNEQDPAVRHMADQMEKLVDHRIRLGEQLVALAEDDKKKWEVRRRAFLCAGKCFAQEAQKAEDINKDFDRMRVMTEVVRDGLDRARSSSPVNEEASENGPRHLPPLSSTLRAANFPG